MIKVLARVTEKGYSGLGRGEYTFVTTPDVSKAEFSTYLKVSFGVDTRSVRTINVKGKEVSRGKRSGKRNDYKKFIAVLKKGQKISDYEISEKK